MKIISISGLDGSGKSTQIQLLREYLEAQGKKVFYFHAVQFSVPQAVKAFFKKHCLICKLIGTCKIDSKPKEEKGVTKANCLQINLRKVALAIDIPRFKRLVRKLESQGYDYILSDRYFYDQSINIDYLSHRSDPSYHSSIPMPDFAFYLDTDPHTIMRRERVPDQGRSYLEDKKKLLDVFAKDRHLTIIDGNQEKESVFEELKKAAA